MKPHTDPERVKEEEKDGEDGADANSKISGSEATLDDHCIKLHSHWNGFFIANN